MLAADRDGEERPANSQAVARRPERSQQKVWGAATAAPAQGIEILASELQFTSASSAAYQLLLAMSITTLDDEIAAAFGDGSRGSVDRLHDKVDAAQNTIVSAYHALRGLISDAGLATVERPHGLKAWKPNHTVSALLAHLAENAADAA